MGRVASGSGAKVPGDEIEHSKALPVENSGCEQGRVSSALSPQAKRWIDDNQAGFDCWNRYVEEHGIPLAENRRF